MTQNPTYEELEKRVQELEKRNAELTKIEADLRVREEQFHTLAVLAPAGIYLCDTGGACLYANPKWCEMAGMNPEQALGKGWVNGLHPEDRDGVFANWQRMVASQGEWGHEYRFQTAAGRVTWVYGLATPQRDGAGKIVGYVGINLDITERKRLETQLHESSQILANVLNHTHMMAVLLDPQFNFIWVNPAYAGTCGREPAFFPGKNHFALYPNEENESIFQKVVDTGEPFFVEGKPFEFPDQPERGVTYWDWSLIPILDAKRKVGKLVFTLVEVTERVRAEDERRRIGEKYRALYEGAAIGIFHSTFDGRFLDVNPALARMLGYGSPQEVVDSIFSIADQIYVTPPRRDEVIAQLLAHGRTVIVENRYRRKNGDEWDAHLHLRQVFDDHGRPMHLEGFVEDVTQQKLTEKELRESEEKYRSLFESSRDAIMTLSPPSWLFTSGNPATVEMFKIRDEAEFILRGPSQLSPENQPDGMPSSEKAIVMIDNAIRNGSHFFEWTHCRSDGTVFPAEVLLSRIDQADKVFIQATVRDITVRKRSEQANAQANEQIRSILDSISDAFFTLDDQLVVGYWNDAAEKVLHRTREEVLGRNLFDAFPEARGSIFEINYTRAVREKIRIDFETYFHVSPYENWYAVRVYPRDGGISVYFQVITERKRAEEELVTSRARLEALWNVSSLANADLKTISDHILRTIGKMTESPYGFYGFINEDESVMTIHSWSGDAMKDCSMVEKPTNFLISESGIWAEAVRCREPLILNNYGAEHPAKKGLPLGHVLITSLLVLPFMVQGRIRSVVAVANRPTPYDQNDVSQLTSFLGGIQAIVDAKQAESELLKTTQRLNLATTSAGIGIWDWDITGNQMVWDDRMLELYGYDKESFPGGIEAWEGGVHPEDRDRAWQECRAALRGEKDWDTEFRVLHPNGVVKHIRALGVVMRNPEGTPVRMLGINYDVTERKLMEQERSRFEVQLRQAQKMESIGSLAGGIAHDFNNILFPIVGLSEMLMDDLPPGSPEHENALEIHNAGRRGSDLVRQILTFSRQSEQKKMPIRIQQILKEVMKLSRSTVPANITLTQDIQSTCSMVQADPTQIHQITMNLITNAYHAVEPINGKIEVRLREVEIGPDVPADKSLLPGRYALLSVSDTGTGIEPAIIHRIFEPYFTTKEQGKGTGLGLAVVYGIVKDHHGDIRVSSELGQGTTFNVYLPIMEKTENTSSVQTEGELSTGHERILLVDDDETISNLEKQMLERLGYHVTKFTSSPDALKVFKANPSAFDLVISDQTMPNMTGVQLAREMMAIRPNVPIIICTGFSERIDKEKAGSMGVKGLLMKPIVKAELAKTVRKVLDEATGNSQQ